MENSPDLERNLAGIQVPSAGPIQQMDQPVDTGVESFKKGEAERDIVPSRWEQFVSGLKQNSGESRIGFMKDEPGTLVRGHIQDQLEKEDQAHNVLKITADEANKKYPGLPVPFNEPVDPYLAELRYADFQKRQKEAEWKDRGGPTPWADFAAEIVGGFADPANMALGLVGGRVFGAAGISKTLAKLGKVGAVGDIYLQNLAANVATGLPSYYQEKKEQQDVTLKGAFGQAAAGAVGGTALHYVAGTLGKAFYGLSEKYRNISPELKDEAVRTVVTQNERGVRPDITPVMTEMKARENGALEGAQSPYRFEPMNHPSERPMYAGFQSTGEPLHLQELGPGTSMTDNPAMVNNLVSNPKGEPGTIARMEVPPEAKLLDLDQPLTAMGDAKLSQALKTLEEKSGAKFDVVPNQTFKDVFTQLQDKIAHGELPPEVMSHIQDIVRSEGFVGYKGVYQTSDGVSHNVVHSFDDQMQPKDQYQANSELTPQRTSEQRVLENQQMDQPHRQETYSSDREKLIHDLRKGDPINSKPEDMEPVWKDQYDAHRAYLDEMAKDNPELSEEIKNELDGENKVDQQEKGVFKKLVDCVRGSTS